MRKEKRKEIVLITILFVLDRFVKGLVFETDQVQINKGASFGFFSDSLPVIYGTSFLFIVLLLHFKKKLNYLGVGLMLGGGLSNLIDRAIFSGVVDYLSFFSLFSFNLADLMISLGLLLILVDLMRNKRLS